MFLVVLTFFFSIWGIFSFCMCIYETVFYEKHKDDVEILVKNEADNYIFFCPYKIRKG